MHIILLILRDLCTNISLTINNSNLKRKKNYLKSGFVYEKLRNASGSIDASNVLSAIGVNVAFSRVKSSSKFDTSFGVF